MTGVWVLGVCGHVTGGLSHDRCVGARSLWPCDLGSFALRVCGHVIGGMSHDRCGGICHMTEA